MQRLHYILFMLTSVFSYGQVTVLTEVNNRDARLNEALVLTVVQEVVGENMEQQTPLQLMDLSKFDILGNASERNTIVDARRGIRINQLIYQVYLQPKVAGKIKIGSALVTVNGKIYKSEPFEINVKDSDRRTEALDYLSKEVFLNLEVEDRVVYENQPTVAVLRAYSKNFDNFRKLENIQVSHQGAALVSPISYRKRDIESDDGEYASQILGTFVIFPKKSGSIEIEPISALIKTPEISKILSNKVKLNVKTLPPGAPASFKDAVGEFRMELTGPAVKEDLEIGKPVEILVKLSGMGNLNQDKLPKILPSEAYQIFSPKISTHLTTDENGVKGDITATYLLVPKRQGALNVITDAFSYFNPATNTYTDLGSKELLLTVLSEQQLAARKTTMDMVNDYTQVVMETVKIPAEKNRGSEYFTFNIRYILLNFGLISGSLLLMFLLYKFRNRQRTALALAPVTTVAEEEHKIRLQMKPDFTAHLDCLQSLKEGGHYPAFFQSYTELHSDAQKWVENHYQVSLQSYIEESLGPQFTEQYADLTRKLAIEKYAPVHDADTMENLYRSIVNIYSEITK